MSAPSLLQLQESLKRLKNQNKDPLTIMLESLFRTQSPEVEEATRRCSIPRWFDTALIAALADEPVTSEQARNILDKINDWEFVQDLGEGRFTYRREIRQHLRSQLKESSPALFLTLNERAHSYFDAKLQLTEKIDEMTWVRLQREQISYVREKMYHLLQIDAKSGFSVFQMLFRGAHRLYLLGEAAALLKFVQELETITHDETLCTYLSYFEAMQQNAEGDRESAEEKLVDLKSQLLPKDLKAQILTLLGTIHHSNGNLDVAVDEFQEALKISNALQLPRQSAALLNNLGSVYLTKKDLNNAEKFFQQALAEFKKIGSITEEAQVLNNLGTVRLQRQQWKQALDFLEKSLSLKSQIGNQFAAATTRVNIGTLYQQMSVEEQNQKASKMIKEKALQHYLESLETFKMMGALSNQAMVLYKLAYFHHEIQDDKKATAFLEEALPIFKTLRLKKDLENAAPLARALHLQI